jgi:hypothetical protein
MGGTVTEHHGDSREHDASARRGGFRRRLVDYAIAGTVGNLLVRGATRAAPALRPALGRATVASLAQGIRWSRQLEGAAEEARLRTGDLLAEARERLGEDASPPDTPASPDAHDHSSL